jgi:hypothetical protein
MRMDSADGVSMLIRPAADGAYEHVLLNHAERKATVLPRDVIGMAEEMVDTSGQVRDELRVVDSDEMPILGHPVRRLEYAFEAAASLPAGGGDQQLPPEMAALFKVTMSVDGIAWVAEGVDGNDEVAAFYTTSGIGLAGQQSGLTRGLTAIMGLVASHGFPLRTTTTTAMRFTADGAGPMAGMMESMLRGMAASLPGAMPTTSTSEVTSVSTAAVDPALFFGGGLPEGYTLEVLGGP